MQTRTIVSLLVLVIGLLVLSKSVYVIDERERAVLLKFGEVVDGDVKPGLHFKIPFVHRVRKFDSRILTLDANPERYLTLEKKSLIVDSFAKWRIIDVQQFYTATDGNEINASRLLAQRINEGLRNEIGKRDMHEVVSGKRDELMEELTTRLNKTLAQELGIEVIDIRVKKVDLPVEVSHSVFERMNTERERIARDHRSKGKEEAEKIRAAADREQIIIQADAYRQAEQLRGEGEAKAAAIYADAYKKNPEFYSFWRSLSAYETAFANKSDILLLKPDSDFFRYLNDSSGK